MEPLPTNLEHARTKDIAAPPAVADSQPDAIHTVRRFPAHAGIRVAFGVGAAFALGMGCRSSPLWPGNWLRRSPDAESRTTPIGSSAGADLGRPTLRRSDSATTIGIAFEVARVEIRSAESRDALKIWNHVDESRLDPAVAVRLARNGIRLGVGTPASWPPIRAVLQASDAALRKDDLAPQRGMPLAVGIDKATEGETIFTYGRDDRLVGRTFDGGERVLNVDYLMDPEGDGRIELDVTLEVRRDRGETTWERRADAIEETPAIDRHLFTEAAARIALAADEFLLLGSAPETNNRYLLGARFFSGESRGQTCDVLLFVTPRVVRTDSARRIGS